MADHRLSLTSCGILPAMSTRTSGVTCEGSLKKKTRNRRQQQKAIRKRSENGAVDLPQPRNVAKYAMTRTELQKQSFFRQGRLNISTSRFLVGVCAYIAAAAGGTKGSYAGWLHGAQAVSGNNRKSRRTLTYTSDGQEPPQTTRPTK